MADSNATPDQPAESTPEDALQLERLDDVAGGIGVEIRPQDEA